MIPECCIQKEKEILSELIELNKDKNVFVNYLKELESVVVKSYEYETNLAEYKSKNNPIFYKNSLTNSKLLFAGSAIMFLFGALFQYLDGYLYAALAFVYLAVFISGCIYLDKIGKVNKNIIETEIGFFHTYQSNRKEIKTRIDNLISSLNQADHDNLLREIKDNEVDELYCFNEIAK
jgi:hypothetical protein